MEKINLVFGKAVGRLPYPGMEDARSSGPNFSAFKPRPWRIMMVCLWVPDSGATMRGAGYKSGSCLFDRAGGLIESDVLSYIGKRVELMPL